MHLRAGWLDEFDDCLDGCAGGQSNVALNMNNVFRSQPHHNRMSGVLRHGCGNRVGNLEPQTLRPGCICGADEPEDAAVLFGSTMPRAKFIGGQPRNPATKMFAGFS
jgi:hypothetical protein